MKSIRFSLGMLVIVLLFGITVVGCDDGSTNGNEGGNLLIGTWVNNWGGKFIFNSNNWEYMEETPIYKGTFTVNNNLLNLKVTHLYSGNEFLHYINYYNLNIELNKWYSINELKSIVGNDLFNYLASENDMDPNTYLIEPVPFSVDRSTLYYGLAIYSKQYIIEKMNLNFVNYGTGSNWTNGDSLLVKDFYSRTLKKKTTYIINVSGELDSNIENFGAHFWQNNWELLGGSHVWHNISSGKFNIKLFVDINDNVNLDQNSVFISFISNETNHTTGIPDNHPNGKCMATINNFIFSIVEY